jgi:hypothetical protein
MFGVPAELASLPPAEAAAAAAAAGLTGSFLCNHAAADGPLDSSWGSATDEEESEQRAKAAVLELLLHPEQVEQQLLQQQEAQQAAIAGGAVGAAAGRPISVSTDYIDAMVKAAVEPMIGEACLRDVMLCKHVCATSSFS